ncbi:MAG: type VI secretion system tube protein Hcp [Gammaproteobacteria bacterium]|nr:type VI secretion system tube protein Hcp [Gammaproteobacteria bacterium]
MNKPIYFALILATLWLVMTTVAVAETRIELSVIGEHQGSFADALKSTGTITSDHIEVYEIQFGTSVGTKHGSGATTIQSLVFKKTFDDFSSLFDKAFVDGEHLTQVKVVILQRQSEREAFIVLRQSIFEGYSVRTIPRTSSAHESTTSKKPGRPPTEIIILVPHTI